MIRRVLKKIGKAVESAVSGVVGAVVDVATTVVKVVAQTGKALVKTVKSAVQTVEKVVNQVGKAVESIGKFVQPLVERYAIQAALVAMGIPPQFAAPMSAGLHTMSKGGSPEDAIKSAATVVVIDKVGQSVGNAARQAGYSAAQTAAAVSAAQSAVATAASGGDARAALQAAAIGSVTGAAGTNVLNATGSANLAAFTESALEAALRGQKIDEAILNGASAATITYMRQIKDEQDRADKVVRDRDAAYTDYVNKVKEYNDLAERYNAATDQETVDNIAVQLDARLKAINTAADNIGKMNQELASIQTKTNELTKKASAEIEKTGGDYSETALANIRAEEENLLAKIQEAAQREFGDIEDRIELVSYTGPSATDAVRLPIRGVPKIIYETPTSQTNEYGIVFDKRTGDVIGELSEDQLRDLRQRLGLPTEQGETIGGQPSFGGAGGPPGTSTVPVTEIGMTPIDGEPGTTPAELIIGDGGTPTGETTATRLPDFENETVRDLMLQQEFFRQQVERAREERQQLEALRNEAVSAAESSTPASRPRFDEEVRRIETEIERVRNIENEATRSGENARSQEETVRADLERRLAEETERTFGRIERQTQADIRRFEQEQQAFERELEGLEREIAQSESDAQAAQARQQFVTAQRQRLSRAGRLPGTLQEQINAEIEDLLDQYETSRERAGTAATRREGLVAPQQPRAGGGDISDEDVIRYLRLGEEEAARYGFTGRGATAGEGAGAGAGTEEGGVGGTPEAPAEGDMELGGGEGEGAPPMEGEAGEGEGIRDTTGRGAVRTNVVAIGQPRTRAGETPESISSRVTGEALAGILGEKEPLFGGDEDEQRAVWNRRSLRLRRALGL